MNRKTRILLASLPLLCLAACGAPPEPGGGGDLAYLDVADLQERMASGSLTAVDLVAIQMQRIDELDTSGPELRSVLEVAPDALATAAELDAERASRGPRGPLHGIPVLLKGNIDTGDDMDTTAGSLALEGHKAPDDALLVAALREAGVVILGKANLSEWANFRSTGSSSGWSSQGGQVRNPHVLDRSPCGSSSGSAVAVAAGLTVLAVGTETDGSVVCPSGVNGIVGVKPTVGLVSRDGIIPIAHTQDTAGPMARSVRDAALLLNAMAEPDPGDPAAAGHPGRLDYTAGLVEGALEGARIGVWRNYSGAGRDQRVEAVFEGALGTLRDLGAVLVDPVDLVIPDEADDAEWEVLQFEFRADLNEYLAAAEVDPSVDSLAKLIEFNRRHADRLMPWFGQEIFELSEAKGPLTDPVYLAALEASHVLVGDLIDAVMAEHELDALVAPTNGPAWPIDWVNGDRHSISSSSPAAVSGYPSVTLPMGAIHGLPIGLSLFGRPYTEVDLLAFAYALERRLDGWRPPEFLETLEASSGGPPPPG